MVNSGGLWRRKGKRSNNLKLPHDEKDGFVVRIIFRNTDLAVRNMVGDRYKLKSGAMKLRKEYVLLLHDVNTLDRVFAGLEQMGGVEAEVERVDHSQIEKLRREVKEDAIKVAKEKATGLAAAIGQSIKEAIYIREEHWGGMAAQYMSNVAFDVDRGGVDAGVDFEKIKLQGTVLVRFKLWYK